MRPFASPRYDGTSMTELRWILLAVGALFIVALAWWELRRPRQLPRERPEHRDPPPAPPAATPAPPLPQMRAREPLRELPTMQLGEAAEPVMSAATVQPVAAPPVLEPVVEWPPEDARRILSLRILAVGERFAGRALRQALAAEGFVHGKLSIYHKAGSEDPRAIVAAASLTQPGSFDLATMDTQRYGGLHLFAVLPGPLPAAQAFEELLSSARNLNERLQGALQDERGEALSAARIGAIREELAQGTPAAAEQPP
jgi:FtsZ-interacting cell division protein ZipA